METIIPTMPWSSQSCCRSKYLLLLPWSWLWWWVNVKSWRLRGLCDYFPLFIITELQLLSADWLTRSFISRTWWRMAYFDIETNFGRKFFIFNAQNNKTNIHKHVRKSSVKKFELWISPEYKNWKTIRRHT